MPIYNTGSFIKESISSIIDQSYGNFELICVNDCSNDTETIELLLSYSNMDKRIRVLNLEANKGAAEARNIGFNNAIGEYTIFLDADDIFKPFMLEKMYQIIKKSNADVCVCGFEYFYQEGTKKYISAKYMPKPDIVYDKTREDWISSIGTIPWNKLCRTSFLRDKHIFFQPLTSNNDVFFSCMINLYAEKVAIVLDEPLLYYRTNTSNQISANRNPVNIYRAVELIRIKGISYSKQKDLEKYCNALLLCGVLSELNRASNEEEKKEAYGLVKQYFEKSDFIFTNQYYEKCRQKIVNGIYEERWFEGAREYYWKLNFLKENLLSVLKKEKEIYIWGMGVHGRAVQRLCVREDVLVTGVADIKNKNIGKTTEYGYLIVNTKTVLLNKGVIVCTNKEIFESLSQKVTKERLINLEEYCPD